jgi:hypothetical protein
LASLAGHYAFVQGFDDPTGADVYPTTPGMFGVSTPGAASGAFDVDSSGRVTAGTLQASKTAIGTSQSCAFAFDATTANGSIDVTSAGARGGVSFTGTVTFGGDCGSRAPTSTSYHYEIGIVKNDVILCRGAVEASLQACAAPHTRVVAVFRKQS